MNRLNLRWKYYSQLIRSSYQPKDYLKNREDFATHVIHHASRLSRKVMERLQFNRVKILDHSQIFVESCALLLHLNRRNLQLTMSDAEVCDLLLGTMPFYKKMTEYIINNNYPSIENFQDKFHLMYLQREIEYYALDTMYGDSSNPNCIANRFINHLLACLSTNEVKPNIMTDLKESAVMFLTQYEKTIRNELDRGYYLFVYKQLLFSQTTA